MTCGDLATKLTAGTGGDAGQAPRHRNQSWPSGSRHTAHYAHRPTRDPSRQKTATGCRWSRGSRSRVEITALLCPRPDRASAPSVGRDSQNRLWCSRGVIDPFNANPMGPNSQCWRSCRLLHGVAALRSIGLSRGERDRQVEAVGVSVVSMVRCNSGCPAWDDRSGRRRYNSHAE